MAVTAGNLGPDATVWEFAVALDASGKSRLSDDLLRTAYLVDPSGRRYPALAFEGGPRAGAHRAGVLKFIALKPRPDWIELRIVRPGEKKPRSFSWLLGSGMVASR